MNYLIGYGDIPRARQVIRQAARHIDTMDLISAAATTLMPQHFLGVLDEGYQRVALGLPVSAFAGDTALYGLTKGAIAVRLATRSGTGRISNRTCGREGPPRRLLDVLSAGWSGPSERGLCRVARAGPPSGRGPCLTSTRLGWRYWPGRRTGDRDSRSGRTGDGTHRALASGGSLSGRRFATIRGSKRLVGHDTA